MLLHGDARDNEAYLRDAIPRVKHNSVNCNVTYMSFLTSNVLEFSDNCAYAFECGKKFFPHNLNAHAQSDPNFDPVFRQISAHILVFVHP